MSIVSVSDLWKIFEWATGKVNGTREARREAAEEWLDAVHQDLEALSKLWTDVGAFLVEIGEGQVEGSKKRAELFRLRTPQYVVAERLEGFYHGTEKVLAADNPFQEVLLFQLATLNLKRSHLCNDVDRFEASMISDGAAARSLLEVIERGIVVLQRQCATLQAAIKNFKGQRVDLAG